MPDPTPHSSRHQRLDAATEQLVAAVTAHVPESVRAPLRTPLAHRLGRWLLRVALVAYFIFAILILVLRYWVMPEIAQYRPNIEQALSTALQRPVQIRELSAHWVGLRPAAYLRGLVIRDTAHQPALQLEHVDAQLGWDSFLVGELRLAHLDIQSPELDLRRDSTGKLFIAGTEVTPGTGDDNAFVDWLLAQERIVVRQAHVRWRDEQRQAPLLDLANVDLKIENSGRRHRFALKTSAITTTAGGAEHLDIRGEFHGRNAATWRDWQGDLYVDLANADLATWQRWFDYPIALTRGHGSAKLWLEVADQSVRKITTEAQLSEVSVRVQPQLPVLELRDLSGRLSLERDRNGFEFKTEKLTLATHDNRQIAPMSLKLRITSASASEQRGQGSVNALDLGGLSAVAQHLPLPSSLAAQLDQLGAQGQLSDVQLSWLSEQEVLRQWHIGARFSALRLQALGPLPHIQGISGTILGNQDSGRLTIASRAAQIELPTLFPEPTLDFAKLDAVVEWDRTAEGTEINLRRASFENQDAAGTASGQWRPLKDDPLGSIDLKAEVPHADGTAVWRYLPSVVGKASRDWLRHAVTGGHASGTSLTLKGKLSDFPFRQTEKGPGGTFEVRSQIRGARLNYGESWPVIEDIDGELVFRGPSMFLTVNKGTSLGAQLHNVRAEIADLELPTTLLTIKGQASGPTSTFLRFIEASPVGESIDHFTRPMSATGNGTLDLSLQLPLDNIEQSKIAGRYHLEGNGVQLDTSLPPISHINGQIDFTENTLSTSNLRGSMLGGPVSATIKTEKDILSIALNGEATVAGLRRYPLLDGLPLLNYLSGASKWAGNIRIGNKGTEVSISTSLTGLSSTLPAPFNKTPAESLPVRVERKPVRTPVTDKRKVSSRETAHANDKPATTAPIDDLLDLTIGKQLRLQVGRRLSAGEPRIVRGVLAVGRSTARLPEKDLLLSIDLPTLDIDFWRQNLLTTTVAPTISPSPSASPSASPSTSPATMTTKPAWAMLPLNVELRTDNLKLMERRFPDVRITGRRIPDTAGDGQTRAEVRSQTFAATLDYNERGAGRLTGVIPQLLIPEVEDDTKAANAMDAPTREIIKRLPSIDLTVEKLAYKKQELGKLTLSAENRAGSWDAKVALRNPDATLDGNAKWRPETGASPSISPSTSHTQVDFHVDAKSLEKLLERIGFPGSMRRGSGQFDGKLSWQGAPISLDYPTLGGSFQFEASDGQFNKLEPGVGRLLGILSLQSLPRRITLDFRDIFSQGFAFDRIAGSFVVKHGIMSTDNLDVRGPAAKVQMQGQIDLGRETQDLTVHVKPAVGESIAVGAMLANPVAGAVAWAAQKLLSDPIDQAFSFDYAVSGSWSDPKVEKLTDKSADKPKSANSAGASK